ncbi:MAG TPA: hypothetical protein VFR49_06180, partial [Solirubrobacteraceae bacterium]|nr:hypothetical protein [Solirubrobacteraceae bacterium]
VQHIPHIIPVVVVWGILIRFWLTQRRLERAEATGSVVAAAIPVSSARSAPPVRRSVALRGLLALGPLVGALATGLVIYALNLGRGHAGAAAIWIHVGIALLAMLLVGYKIADVGRKRLREAVTVPRAWRTGGSIVLLALWVPLLASGVALLVAPSGSSFTAYAHLIASVWWTALLLWHLRRYLVRATSVVLFDRPRRGGPAPAAVRPGPPPSRTRRGSAAPAPPAAPVPGRQRRAGAGTGHSPAPGETSPIGETEAAEEAARTPVRGR